MGIRLHRTIGYGIKPADFHANSELKDHEEMWQVAMATKELIIPQEVCNYLDDTYHACIISKNLLSFDHIPKETTKYADNAYYGLMALAMTPDETLAYIFFPSAVYSKEWNRSADTLDHAFNRIITEKQDESFLEWRDDGFYPYNNLYENAETGFKLSYQDNLFAQHSQPKKCSVPVKPYLPAEIRWYVQEVFKLNHTGVQKIMPVIAQYWC